MRKVVALCAIGVVGGAAACSRPQAQSVSPAVPTVAVAKVARGDISRVLTVAAEFRPYQEIDVHAKVAGFVKSIEVDVGDRVKAGQLIAILEVPELQNDLQQDEASVLRATEEVNRAGADLERAQSAHEMAHLGADRLIGVMPGPAESRRAAGHRRGDRTRPRRRSAGLDRQGGARVGPAAARDGEGQSGPDADAVRVRAHHGAVRRRHHASIRRHRRDDPGGDVVADPDDAAREAVAERSAAACHPGARVGSLANPCRRNRSTSRVQALDTDLPGTVARFAQRLDADTRTMRVEVDVPNPRLELVPGMYAQASIALDRATGVLTLPVQAVDRLSGKPRVVIVNHENRIEVRDVELGLESADRVVVRAGLQAGELVVLGNRAQLKAGMHVSPREMPVGLGLGW